MADHDTRPTGPVPTPSNATEPAGTQQGAIPRGATWRVACAQLAARELAEAETALEEALEAIDGAAQAGTDLVLLPECTYPAYFLAEREAYRSRLRPDGEVLAAFAERARRHRMWVAVGLALERAGRLVNSVVLFDRGGREVARAEKQFLWHFDGCWFAPGQDAVPVETEFGRLGMFVCADGRVPEIARSLALQGAGYLLDATAWVASGATVAELRNAQADYMMEVRALENGVYLLAANKVGHEAGAIRYCGKSLIAAPDGAVVARASVDRPELIVAELPRSHRPAVAAHDGQGGDDSPYRPTRRPQLYQPIVAPLAAVAAPTVVASGAASRVGAAEGADRDAAVFVAVGSVGWPASGTAAAGEAPAGPALPGTPEGRAAAMPAMVRRLLVAGGWLDARLVVLPDFSQVLSPAVLGTGPAREAGEQLIQLVREASAAGGQHPAGQKSTGVILGWPAPGSDGTWQAVVSLFDGGAEVARYVRAHLAEGEGIYRPGEEAPPVVDVGGIRVGLMGGLEGFLPEVARGLALQGAELVVWVGGAGDGWLAKVTQTRAGENRVFVASSALAAPWGAGQSLLAGPSGTVLASTLVGAGVDLAAAWLLVAEARFKRVVPGTDVLTGRRPERYGVLAR